jgi:hypothetical protein
MQRTGLVLRVVVKLHRKTFLSVLQPCPGVVEEGGGQTGAAQRTDEAQKKSRNCARSAPQGALKDSRFGSGATPPADAALCKSSSTLV